MDLTQYGVNLDALTAAAKGIEAAVAALAEMDNAQSAAAGRGVTNLALSRVDTGHDGLASALGDFCDRWAWGVRCLVQEGMEIRDRLLDTRDAYQRAEDAAATIFKRVLHDVVGNPMGDSGEASRESWEELAEEQRPDFSAGSLRKGMEGAAQNLKTVPGDLVTIGRRAVPPGMAPPRSAIQQALNPEGK